MLNIDSTKLQRESFATNIYQSFIVTFSHPVIQKTIVKNCDFTY